MPNAKTEKALDEITRWARELAAGGSPDNGTNITFEIARQSSLMFVNDFVTSGDCTPFVPSGKRGTLHNQPLPQVPPPAIFIRSTLAGYGVDEVDVAMEADLNTGTVTLQGAFPELAPKLVFGLEYFGRFTNDVGKNMLFYSRSDKSDDKAGYLSVFCLVIE
jgi:hypothetical protein